jgi:hypothetical protein
MQETFLSTRYAVFTRNKIQYIVTASIDHTAIKKQFALYSSFAHSGVMYYKEFIMNGGMYRSTPLEDYDLWLRMKDIAMFHILDEVLLVIEYTGGRLSTQNVVQKYKNHYILQQLYYEDLQLHFGISDKREEHLYRGWREYFYGDKRIARKHWAKLGRTLLRQPRVILAWVATYLSENMLIRFKEYRPKFRVLYLVNYFTKTSIRLRKQFALLIR